MQSDDQLRDSSIPILRCDVSAPNSMRGIETTIPNIDLELLMPNRTQYDLLLHSIEVSPYGARSDAFNQLIQ